MKRHTALHVTAIWLQEHDLSKDDTCMSHTDISRRTVKQLVDILNPFEPNGISNFY